VAAAAADYSSHRYRDISNMPGEETSMKIEANIFTQQFTHADSCGKSAESF
ncbi:unnamed protein product, partial [Ceratitis capitata]